jgi:amino acid adenylation domain-containing protein
MNDFSGRLSSLTPEQRALFESRLRKRAAARPKQAVARASSIPKRKRRNHCLLSFDQERIWIIDRMEPGNPAYNIYTASRLLGPLDLPAMERAVNEIVKRHEILRTTFTTVAGEPVMVISPESTLRLPLQDISSVDEDERLSEARRLVNHATALPFDLEAGPLLRVGVIRLGEEDHVVHVTMHHTITDRWSAAVLEQEMVAIYSAFTERRSSPLAPVEIQFADFAEWQRDWLQGEVLAAKVDYWRNQLRGAPLVLDLPSDRPRPPFQKFRGARELINLPEPLLKRLKALTQREGATMFMTLLAAYNLLLYRYTGQEDILVGLAMANRNRPETENMLGYLLNMVIIRAKFSPRTTFRELLEIVRQSSVGAFANLDLPLGSLIEELKPSPDPSRNPIFQVAYIYLDFPPEAGMESLKVKPVPLEADNGASRFDMTLALTELPDRLETLIEFNTDIFEHETIQRMLQHFRVLLEGIVANADLALCELPMLTDSETRQLLENWNNSDTPFPRDLDVHHLAEMTVERAPDSVGVSFGDSQLTFAELNGRANRLAHYLITLGAGPGASVAVCLRRSPELVAVLLAVLKTGSCYVPLDPDYPVDRVAHMLEDSLCYVLVSQDALIDSLPAHLGITVSIDGDWRVIEEQRGDNVVLENLPDSPAYIIYTSGSTGGPRGVSVPHRAIMRLVLNSNYVDLTPNSIIAQCSNSSFDAATFEIWGSLLNAARLVIIDRNVALSPGEFVDEIRRQGITVMFLTTALFNELVRHNPRTFASIQCLLFGGEAVTPAWVKSAVDAGGPENLLHVYGPTESTTFSSFFCVGSVSGDVPVPIGLPISNTTVHVVDRNLGAVPAGVDGELLVGGEGLAHCYVNRPELTADKFIPNPFAVHGGKRLYRSGDLVRRRPDGNVVFMGRNDFQVKIRGFRIEMEEIEAVIKRHPGIVDAVVAVSPGSEHERRLVAYVVPRPGTEITTTELRRFVAERLPEYMAPSWVVAMDGLPLTANGKVDRSSLPDPGQARPDLGSEYVAPRTRIEQSLCEIWARVLGLERVGVRDNFFDLGGDSIRSIQIMSRSEESGYAFSIQELFQNPTVESLAAILESRTEARQTRAPIEPFSLIDEEERARLPESVEDAYPLTMLQAGMVFHSDLSPSTPVYHDIFSFHIRSPLEPELMRESLNVLIGRHPILRTSLSLTGPRRPLQLVHRAAEASVSFDDISDIGDGAQRDVVDELVASEKSAAFSWDCAPLLRLWLHRRSPQSSQFTLSFHHAILDGWSLATLLAELFEVYQAKLEGRPEPLPSQPVTSFRDFVALEIETVNSEESRRFWRDRIDSAPFTSIPRRASTDAEPSGEIGVFTLELDEAVTEALHQLSRKLGVPLKSLLLAGHSKVIALLSGRNDIVTGTIANGRPEEGDADKVLGLFLNTLPLRIRFEPAATWEELAMAAFAAEKEALPHRRYPLAEMQRVTGRNPMLEIAFNYTHFHAVNGVLGAQGIEILEDQAVSETNFPFLVDFNLDPDSNVLQAAIKYDRALFDEDQIGLIAGYYVRAMHLMAVQPGACHASSPLLSAAEISALVEEFNATEVDYGTFRCVHELVAEQARRTSDTIGLAFGDSHCSYEALDREANRLASFLVRQRSGPDMRIGIALDRSASMCVAVLGVLKTGAAYVPLDPSFPSERLEAMLQSVDVLLTEDRYADRFYGMQHQDKQVLCLETLAEAISTESGEAPSTRAGAENLVYVVFTSGSTGGPKGVAVTHKVATNLVQWSRSALMPGRRVLQFASLSFDVAFQELFSTWASGGTLVLISDADRRDSNALAKLIEEQQVERLFLPPVALQPLAEEILSGRLNLAVKEVITAGEQLDVSHAVRCFFEDCDRRVLHNHYGPSETHVATKFELEGSPSSWPALPPIGSPVANAAVYLLNENLEVAPGEVPAEIFIGGEVVGRGYSGRPDLTAQSFICNPFGPPGSRLYRTGDLGRLRRDRQIQFLGRLDQQVKVRGFRVEVGEIEAALSSHPFVQQAVVTAAEGGAGGRKLVAHVVPIGEAIDFTEIAAFLSARLPDYMVPSEYVLLESLPLTATGKLDRRALRAADKIAPTYKCEYIRPATPTEEAVAAIWSEVLGKGLIDVRDNFFDLGGHSLVANQIVSRIRIALGLEIPLKTLFEHPTIQGLSAVIDSGLIAASDGRAERIIPRDLAAASPLSIAQRRLWFLEQLDPHQGAYHIEISLSLAGGLNRNAVEQALAEIVGRHEVLRSRIFDAEGTPFQSVEPLIVGLRYMDLAALPEPERLPAASELISSLHSRIFDFGEGSLARFWLAKIGDREHILAVTLHHLVCDGWSIEIFKNELSTLCESFSAGAPSALNELRLQYRDFAAWQSDWSRTKRFESSLAYWKRQLDGHPVVDIPSARRRPPARTFGGTTAGYRLDASSRNALKRIADAESATPFMAYLAAFLCVLYRYTGQSDLVVGAPVSGRNRTEIEPLIGCFVNTLVLRTQVGASLNFLEAIRQVKKVALDAYANQEVPFELLVEELQPDRDPSRSPIFDVMFDVQTESAGRRRIGDLQLVPFQHESPASRFDLTFSISDSIAEPAVSVEFSTDLFERPSIDRFVSHFNRLVESGAAMPDCAVAQLPLMPELEIRQIVEGFNDADCAFPEESCIYELFDEEARRRPDSVALAVENEGVTYRTLNRKANALARVLADRGISGESRVGICLPRSTDMIVSMLAVLEAGGAYVPMDATYPSSRLEFIATDANIEAILTHSESFGGNPTEDRRIIYLDKLVYGDEAGAAPSPAFPESLAYVIYTSGTTGTPKGVAVTHRGVIRLVKNANYAELDPSQVILQVSTVSFDVATFEIWGCLLNGGKLVLVRDEMASLEEIARTIAVHGITTLWLTAGLFHLMVERELEALYPVRQLLAGGEALQADDINRFISGAGPERLINGYGPTEVTTFTCWYRFGEQVDTTRAVPIGRPISNTAVHLLDDCLNVVPVWVKSQLHASGPGLARCYLNNPDLTAQKFSPNPFSVAPGDRMYATGDAARYCEDGNIEFLGRLDRQIKLRGFRIELGEIESVLASSPDVGQAVVIVQTDAVGERRLAAYATPAPGASLSPDDLRRRVKAALPEFMIPTSILILDTLPLTKSGKVDTRALPVPERDVVLAKETFEPPRNTIEEGLARIWELVLGREPVGVYDDFFDLGGHSLLATQVVSRIREAFQIELPLRSLFENRNIARLGVAVEALLLDKLDALSEEEAAELLR